MKVLGFTLAFGLLAVGCSRTPSPLTPGVVGITIGTPSHGVLRGGTELPPSGPGWKWLRPVGGQHHGLPRLVSAIQHAAEHVQQHRPGPPVIVGDLSAKAGGKIVRHASHRTGRDVDLLFYVTTPEGAPVENPGFLNFGPDGLAYVPERLGGPGYVRLDVERQWLMTKALLENPDANVQWIFVSEPIEALLIEYAQARGEDPELVFRALTVLKQPSNGLPHDDHFHVRTACLPDEFLVGCEGGGPYWAWLPELPSFDEWETDEDDHVLLTALLEPMTPELPGDTPLVDTAEAREGGRPDKGRALEGWD